VIANPKPGEAWEHPKGTLPVGSFKAGATPDGIFDLLGNVWEWTITQNDLGQNIQRGGSWMEVVDRITMVRTEDKEEPDSEVGFRCIK